MLWSDPVDETAQERRRQRALLRHAGVLIAVLAVLIMALVMGW
ncbi:morphogenic membrane protein MmpB [Streptacidiphilus sp. N1-12]|uniref:Morphogenic membrane protein MmpB n=2 Tax=Streptacidiphilus alkalitolerans TaxID=3342712 RepID=A0ABV6X4K5_9ACTN